MDFYDDGTGIDHIYPSRTRFVSCRAADSVRMAFVAGLYWHAIYLAESRQLALGRGRCPMHGFFRLLTLAALSVILFVNNERSLLAQGVEKDKPATKPDTAAIAKLVKKLAHV